MTSTEKIEKFSSYDYAWLDLEQRDLLNITNPLLNRSDKDIERPDIALLRVMRNPKYFWFTCKHLFNIDLLPIQVAILQELWVRPFPMFVASRGFGKAIRGNEKVRVQNGWREIKDIEVGDRVYSSDGTLCNVTQTTSKQQNLNFYRVTLRDGRTIDCCEDHMWKVWDKNRNKKNYSPIYSELTTKKMLENYYWVRKDSKSKTHKLTKEYRFALPINDPIVQDTEQNHILHPYVVGVLLGDGCLTQKSITITSNDRELIDRINTLLPDGYIAKKQESSQHSYGIKRINKKLPPFHVLCKKVGIWGFDSHTKFIPENYQYGSVEQRLELIRGLMDTDGYSSKSVIEYYTVSNQLSADFLNVARSLGLHCKHSTKESWFKKNRYADCNRISIYTKVPIFTLSRKLQYTLHNISRQGQSKYDKVFITNIEYIGKEDGYCISVDSEDKTYITKDYIVTHNSFLLAVYAWLKMVLIPETKIVVVGSGFRQSKIILEYMETIWKKAPILRSISDRRDALSKDVDRWRVAFHDSWAIAVPIGDGQKIRGLRAHTVIADEFACLDENTIIETNNGLMRIKDTFIDGIQILNQNGQLETPSKFIKTPLTDVYEIKTSRGYGFKCSNIHKVKTSSGWKLAKDLTKYDYLVFDNQYVFPNKEKDVLTRKEAWLLGLVVAKGTCTKKNGLSIKTTDVDTVNKIRNEYSEYLPKIYTRTAYVDSRGWNCKQSYEIVFKKALRDRFFELGLEYVTSHKKEIPSAILKSSRDVVISFLSGLFDGDGSAFIWESSGRKMLGIAYYSVSEKLINEIHILLSKLNIIGNKVSRSSKMSNNMQWMLRFNSDYAHFLFEMLNIDRWHAINIADLDVDKKPKKLGVTFAKDKKKWKCSPYYCGKLNNLGYYHTEQEAIDAAKSFWETHPSLLKVSSVTKLAVQQQLYDYELPDTHSFYGNGFVQHNSIPLQIYETVIAGFGAVSADPIDNVKAAARRRKMKSLGLWNEELEASYEEGRVGNQSIITGTADYAFKPFAQYHNQYQRIINSKGDMRVIADIYGGEENVPESFDWRNYAVIRIPYELIPEGFMDDKTVARAKATVHNGIFQMEYGAVFTEDSEGFFKRSLIESCVTSDIRPIYLPSGPVWFDAVTKGNPKEKYVYGVDPASENDNFTITVLQLMEDHTRVVYCWATNRKNFKERQDAGLSNEHDYYAYCARKIRDLMRTFPPVRIGMDSQGGGVAVMEALHDPDKMYPGEQFLWPIINPEKSADTDLKQGLHIVELVNFASAEWTGNANHGMRKDLEDKVLLFPRFDPITLGLAHENDAAAYKAGDKSRLYDSLEDCVMEIEELKDELAMIVMTKTLMGNRDRWDTPEIKGKDGKKGRLRKDRYSSLVIANMLARVIHRTDVTPTYIVIGGAVHNMVPANPNMGQLYAPIGNHVFEPGIFQAVRRI